MAKLTKQEAQLLAMQALRAEFPWGGAGSDKRNYTDLRDELVRQRLPGVIASFQRNAANAAADTYDLADLTE